MEEIAAAAVKLMNDKRAKGSDRSPEQIAARKASNDKCAKGSDRSSERIAAIKAINDKRPQGSDRSPEEIAASNERNDKRPQGTDRSPGHIAKVKIANEPLSREKKRNDGIHRLSMNKIEMLIFEGEELWTKDDFAGALKKYQEATTVASKPCYRQYYCKLEAFLAFSLTLEKMGDLRGAIEAFREVSKLLSEDFEPNIRVTELLVVSMHNLIFDALMMFE